MGDKVRVKNKPLTSLGLTLTLFLISLALLATFAWKNWSVGYWLKPPEEKFLSTWTEDFKRLRDTKQLPVELSQLREYKFTLDSTPNSPVDGWISKIKPPLTTTPQGKFRAIIDVFFIIEGYRYGVSVQFHIEDIATRNTVNEFGRTYLLGLVY